MQLLQVWERKVLEPSHECLLLPNPDSRTISNNDGNVMIRIKYTSDLYDDKNETYYACADIRYVVPSEFHINIPGFNATADDTTESPGSNGSSSAGNDSGAGALYTPSFIWVLLSAVVALVVFV